MWTLLSELAMLPVAVYFLLLGYRRIGKPEGEDPKQDAWFKQWSGSYKFLGWGLMALVLFGLISSLAFWITG